MTLNQAIVRLSVEYSRARVRKYIKNPLAYALHKVWKEADKHPLKKCKECDIDGDELVLYDGIATIIYQNKKNECRCRKIYINAECEDEPISLNDCLGIMDFQTNGVVYVIFETATNGEIYCFGNYLNGKWYKCGDTIGYA